jgi:hypothetical protein
MLAVKGKKTDEAWIDYLMSKEFGLDWKSYPYSRMTDFISILKIENNNAKDGQRKHSSSPRDNNKRR